MVSVLPATAAWAVRTVAAAAAGAADAMPARGVLLAGEPVAAAAVIPPMAATAARPAVAMMIRERRMAVFLADSLSVDSVVEGRGLLWRCCFPGRDRQRLLWWLPGRPGAPGAGDGGWGLGPGREPGGAGRDEGAYLVAGDGFVFQQGGGELAEGVVRPVSRVWARVSARASSAA